MALTLPQRLHFWKRTCNSTALTWGVMQRSSILRSSRRPSSRESLATEMRIEGERSVEPVTPHHLEAAKCNSTALTSTTRGVMQRLLHTPLIPAASWFSSSRSKTAYNPEVSRKTVTSANHRPRRPRRGGGGDRWTYHCVRTHSVRRRPQPGSALPLRAKPVPCALRSGQRHAGPPQRSRHLRSARAWSASPPERPLGSVSSTRTSSSSDGTAEARQYI